MKKIASLALAAALGICSLHAADTLSDDPITVTGTISFPSNQTTSFSKTKTVPLTVANVLKLLGPLAIDPSKARFFYDSTQNTMVIASKDKATIYTTLLAYGTNYISWNTDAKNSSTGATDVTSLGALTGTDHYATTFLGHDGSYLYTDNFTVFGTLNQTPVIMKAKLTDRHIVPASK